MTRTSILSVATALTILTASCGGNKEKHVPADNQQKETVANVDVHGQWYLDSIVFSDSEYVRVRPDVRLSSIHKYTEMACDNMAVEDALRRILPNIAMVYIQNDSIARLDSRNPSEYIVLCKAPIEIKRKTENL